MKQSILIVLLNKKIKNLGGQERRWLRLIGSNLLANNVNYSTIINDYTVHLSKQSDVSFIGSVISIKDIKNKYFDYINKCIHLVVTGSKYDKIYISNQSMYLIPAIIILKYFYRKKILFSYNGNSLLVHKNRSKILSYYNKIKLIMHIAEKIEILNPILVREKCLPLGKVFIAPCTFSDVKKFSAQKKKKIIVFAGHLNEQKGINLLKKILLSPDAQYYTIKIFGDSDFGDQNSISFKNWLINHCIHNKNILFEHRDNMQHVYSDAAIFISLQKNSNYPSQSVVEALYSGCSILLTDSGDSRLFGDYEYLSYVEETASTDLIFHEINKLYLSANKNRNIIESRSKEQHSINRYAKFMIGFLND